MFHWFFEKKNRSPIVLQKTFRGHEFFINSLLLLFDGRLASASQSNEIRVWNLESGQCEQILRGHTKAVNSLAILPTGKIVSASCDETIKVWDVSKGLCQLTLIGHEHHVMCLAITPDGKIISGSADQTVKIWNISSESCELTFSDQGMFSNFLAPIGDNEIISVDWKSNIRFFNRNHPETIETFMQSKDTLNACVLHQNGWLISAIKTKIKLFDTQKKKHVTSLRGHRADINSLAIMEDGRLLANDGSSTRIWNLGSWKSEVVIAHALDRQLHLLPLARSLIASSCENLVSLWAIGHSVEPTNEVLADNETIAMSTSSASYDEEKVEAEVAQGITLSCRA